MNELTLEQTEALFRRIIRQELDKRQAPKTLSDTWATEAEVLELCGKKRVTLLRAIESGRIHPNDVRPNPIGKGYLLRRSALVPDKLR